MVKHYLFILLSSFSVMAATYTDGFNVSHNYLANGVVGSIWDGLIYNVNGGNCTVYSADANLTTSGRLTLSSVYGAWQGGGTMTNDDGVLLYKNVSGDFDVSVQVVSADVINYNDMGLMARQGGQPATAENFIGARYFAAGGINGTRNVINSLMTNLNQSGLQPWLRMTRVGDVFTTYRSTDGLNWSQMNAVTRNDLAGVPMQVGIWQGTFFTGNTGKAQFDNFKLVLPMASTIALSSSANPAAAGNSITFTAAVQTNGVTAGNAGGAITFLDGLTTLGVVSVTNGVAALSNNGLLPGFHTITALYGGDGVYQAGSNTLSLPVSFGGQFIVDDFSISRDYLSDGIVGTIWNGLIYNINGGNCLVVHADANNSNPGQLTFSTMNGAWNGGGTTNNDNGVLLYKDVSGDFDAQIQITGSDLVNWNDLGLMAREEGAVATNENFVSARYFAGGGRNSMRSVVNGSMINLDQAGLQPWLRLTRVGNVFTTYRSTDGINWNQMNAIARTDLTGTPMQVGIWQATFTNNTGTAKFDHFSLAIGTATTLTLTTSENPTEPGTNITFTAMMYTNGVQAASAGGMVVFSMDGIPSFTRAVISGVASYSIGALPFGTHTVTATYCGDSLHLGSYGAPLIQVVSSTQAIVTNIAKIQANARGGIYIGNQAPLQPSALIRLPVGSIQPQGWLLTELQNQRNGLNGRQEEISQYLQSGIPVWTATNGYGVSAKQDRQAVAYWLRGYFDMGCCLQDQTVISNATQLIKSVMLSQRTNGYFGPDEDYGDATTTSDLGINAPDLWPQMPMLDAFQSYYEYTGDTNALNLMRNYALWEYSLPPSDFGNGYWPMMRMGDNIENIYWLYNRLGESWLLTLANNMYANMARWDTPGTLPNWHNVNIAEAFRAPTVYWQQSSNATQLLFAEANYQVVMQQYGQVPGGGFGGDEICRPGYYGPRQAFETCGWVEFMRSFEILTRITGNPVWAERCEDVAANSFPASMTTNQMALHYLTAPNQPELDKKAKAPDINNAWNSTWFSFSPTEPEYHCCEHNYGMGWPYFCEETWMATWDKGLCASLYAPTIVHARVADGSVISVTETTDYPFGDSVGLDFATTNSVAFPLYLRVPQWCSNSWIQVNGVIVATNSQPSSYVCISRTWTNGDSVVLHFPRKISVRTWTANNNSVSVNYGPLTFSLQIAENWQSYGTNPAPWTEQEVYPASPWNYGLEIDTSNPASSFSIITNNEPMASCPFSLQTIPIQLQAKARKIPAWTLDSLYAVGPMQPSPAYSTQAQETVTLVPMGAARLRIAAFPTVTTNIAAMYWGAPYLASASYTNGTDTVLAMNDALVPASSSDTSIPRMTWFNHLGTAEWARADFNGLCQVDRVSVYWYDNAGSYRVPQSWWVEYLSGTNWVPVTGASGYGVIRDQFNTVRFDSVQTTAVRLRVQLQGGASGGILEWQVPATPVNLLATRYSLDSDVNDSVSAQTGVLNGGTFVVDRFGVAGEALQFNGTSSYVIIPRPNYMDWTIACWIKTTATGGSPNWYNGKGLVDGEVGGATDDFGIALVGDRAAFGVGNPDTTITSTTAINDNIWHHVAAVRNAVTGLMQLYVDGILQSSTNGPSGPKTSPSNLRIGSLQTGVLGGFFAGTIDDVQIFNRTLTASEISSAMNQLLTLNPVGDLNLSAGQTMIVTNSAVDAYVPPRILSWSLTSGPVGATIDPADGTIMWRPDATQAGSTNTFVVQVADSGSPSLTANMSFQVVVGGLTKPQIGWLTFNNGKPQFKVVGSTGPDYVIEVSTNLALPESWQPLSTNLSPTTPFTWTDEAATNIVMRFYRVRLSP